MQGGDPPRIMILGGNFLGKGAEAMLMTVRETVRQALPDAVFCVPVYRPSEFEAMQAHGFIPILYRSDSRWDRIATALRATLGLLDTRPIDPADLGRDYVANPFRAASIVIDISGFASGDQIGWRKAFGRWRDHRAARAAGARCIFMPQSWGPFRHPAVRLFTRHMLRNADLIFAREQQSYDDLLSLAAIDPRRVFLVPDIAFHLPAASPEAGRTLLARYGVKDFSRPLIGITPNRQIYRRMAGQAADNAYLRLLCRILRYFLQETEATVVLIPHEIETDDRLLCQILCGQVGPHDRLVQLTGTESAADVKSVIGHLEFLVASRYHSLVAALALTVPAVVLGWSHKYEDLLHRAGLESWGIDLTRQPEDVAYRLVLDAWARRGEIRARAQETVPEIRSDSRRALDRMVAAVCDAWERR